jgi:hypothetical protein
MHTIQLELDEELARKLDPYRDKIPELLELGLGALQERERREHQEARERLLRALEASGKIKVPEPYTGEQAYVRHSPPTVAGKPVGQIVIEQRGSL